MTAFDIDPVALQFGPLKVHWYGLMYLLGFAAGWWLGVVRARRPGSGWLGTEIADLLFYVAVGVILGGRLGYVVFYNAAYYLEHPAELLTIWRGGMSFHGGLLGVMAAMLYYARKTGRSFWAVADFVAPLVPIALGAGRLGNFINQELWGKTTTLPWGVVFRDAGPLPRHPTQLYEAGLEGAALFVILWLYSRTPRPLGRVSGLFLVGYAVFRFTVEFLRLPDAHIGYLAGGWLTEGQLLCIPMALFGGWLLLRPSRLA